MSRHAVPVETLLDRVANNLASQIIPRHSRLLPAAAEVLRPGKMFRPRMTLGIATSLGMSDPDAAVQAATAVELLHMSSLVHDDLMDSSPHRRGVPSLHIAASPAAAIAVGNLLLARAAGIAADLGPQCARVFARALDQLWEGQLMEPELVGSTSAGPHLQYIALKTAALMEAAAALGALSQGATAQQAAQAARFGHEVGMAFQIADDLLDHIGDPAALGKEVGGDLVRGVVSLGAWHALTLHGATPDTMDAADIDRLAAQDASIEFAVGMVGDHLQSARRALQSVTPDAAVWENATVMIGGMLERSARPEHRHVVVSAVKRWPA